MEVQAQLLAVAVLSVIGGLLWGAIRGRLLDITIPKPSSLPLRAFGFHPPNAYTWEDWEVDAKTSFPFRYWLTETVPSQVRRLSRKLGEALYWLRTHTYNRYHILDLRNDFYRWGWSEVDDKMLFACFNLLVEFVEGEGSELEAMEGDEKAAEVKSLYDWWKNERAIEQEQLDPDAADEKDQLMLHRLIEVRGWLWT